MEDSSRAGGIAARVPVAGGRRRLDGRHGRGAGAVRQGAAAHGADVHPSGSATRPRSKALLREALRRSDRHKRDVAILLPADFSADPSTLPEFLKRIDSGADVIVGEATLEGEPDKWQRRVRTWAPRLLGRHGRVEGVRDVVSGFAAFRLVALRNAFRDRADPGSPPMAGRPMPSCWRGPPLGPAGSRRCLSSNASTGMCVTTATRRGSGPAHCGAARRQITPPRQTCAPSARQSRRRRKRKRRDSVRRGGGVVADRVGAARAVCGGRIFRVCGPLQFHFGWRHDHECGRC